MSASRLIEEYSSGMSGPGERDQSVTKAKPLSPEEQKTLDALGPPHDANANIDWSQNKKWLKISRRTWTTKTPDMRLARARLDLFTAGFEEDARLLTNTRLYTAWQKLSTKERGDLMAECS